MTCCGPAHPLQPIRDAIADVYSKALADGHVPAQDAALDLFVALDRLRVALDLPPISRGRDA
jgi:hypothetical protein